MAINTTPACLVCETSFEVQQDWDTGEIIECVACGQEHEVVEMSSGEARVELAPEVEEDWGE
jgi:alpha-aminoadipate carrier protein LysW